MGKPSRIIKLPSIKYQEAREYQQMVRRQQGLNLPLWAALTENEKQKMLVEGRKDFDKMFRRFL